MPQKWRLFSSFVLALGLLGIAVPRLPFYETQMSTGFSFIWLMFCLLVIAANFHALLKVGHGEEGRRELWGKEKRQAIRRIQRYKPRRMVQK